MENLRYDNIEMKNFCASVDFMLISNNLLPGIKVVVLEMILYVLPTVEELKIGLF